MELSDLFHHAMQWYAAPVWIPSALYFAKQAVKDFKDGDCEAVSPSLAAVSAFMSYVTITNGISTLERLLR